VEERNHSSFSPQVEECVLNLGKFHNIVRLVAFCPFSSSQVALENANAVSEGELTTDEYLRAIREVEFLAIFSWNTCPFFT
jgi:hypothetical protein